MGLRTCASLVGVWSGGGGGGWSGLRLGSVCGGCAKVALVLVQATIIMFHRCFVVRASVETHVSAHA